MGKNASPLHSERQTASYHYCLLIVMMPYTDTGISTSAHRTQNLPSNSLINPDSNSEAPLESSWHSCRLSSGLGFFSSGLLCLQQQLLVHVGLVRFLSTPTHIINIRGLLGGLVATWQPLKIRSWQNTGTICLLYVQSMRTYFHCSAPSDIVHANCRLDDGCEILNFKAAKLTL